MKDQLDLLPGFLAAHLGLSLAALALGMAISVPIGIVVTRYRRLEVPVVGGAGVLQTIPSLALLAFMVPVLAALGVPSIGYLPALVGLSLYSLLPILRNTVVGLSGIDPAVIEAARGVGMTPRESLLRVELPLALPVIVAGIRTSAVWTVGTATLSTPVGAPSLGNYIFGGLQTRHYGVVLLGCVASAALALTMDGLVHLLMRGITERQRRLTWLSLLGFVILAVYAAFPLVKSVVGRTNRPIVIGAKTFTESYILAQILAEQVRRQTALPVRVLESMGSTIVFDALANGQIDAYVDYSGTLWTTVLKHGDPRPDREALLGELTRELKERYGISVIGRFGFENTYALALRREDARRLAVRRIGDLGPHVGNLRMGGDYELFQRSEWRAILSTYRLSFAEQRVMDPSLMYEAIRTQQVDVIAAYSTDGRIAAYDLVALEDDRAALPPYDAVLLVGERLLRERPQVIDALRQLSGRIDVATMQQLNRGVDEEKKTPAQVAKQFLDEGNERRPSPTAK
ncbi:MAG: ABC transporter permease/substrate-binding protein [Blastocatellia bacterium]|jgi:osmoprotectant transport system permease protein